MTTLIAANGALEKRNKRTMWMAKAQTAKSARFVGGQGIQLHGGMGMTDELVVGHYYKRLTQCESLYGDGEWYLKRISANLEG